eukprot:m.9837 g.9837  ORF g.9837 m.9837 type:complete len:526 (+) comp4143_c0_seq2:130-1707(+)
MSVSKYDEDSDLTAHEDTENTMSPPLKWAAVFAALGGILFGYDMGIISGALLQMEIDFNMTTIEKSLVVSFMLVGAIFASLTSGYIIDYLGRRGGIILNSAIFILGGIGLTFAQDLNTIYIFRFIVGYGIAFSAVSECIYISEISPAYCRGMLVSLNELGIALGIMLSYTANFIFIDTYEGWRYMFGLALVPAVIQGIGMFFMPMSPRWLLMQNRDGEAKLALGRFRTGEMASPKALDRELQLARNDIDAMNSVRLQDLFKDEVLRRAMVISFGITLFTQLTGQPNVLYYAATIIKSVGVTSNRSATLVQMVLGLVKVIATGLALLKIDSVGRRFLLLIGSGVMTVSLCTLATVSYIAPIEYENSTTSNSSFFEEVGFSETNNSTEPIPIISNGPKWISIVSLFTFVIAFAFSYGPVAWLLLSELFPNNIRARAVSLATIFNWGTNLVVSVSFLSLIESIGVSGTFFLYTAIGALAMVFNYVMVPETKGKTLEDIQAVLMHKRTHCHRESLSRSLIANDNFESDA